MTSVYPVVVPYAVKHVALTDGFLKALVNLMQEECKMMRARRQFEDVDSWTWGRAEIGDLADQTTLEFGGEDDRPEDQFEDFMVFVKKPVDDD